VHGGPWVRGRSWNWNDDAQFLASRGYVVIEPEYRGSAGYGFAHFRAGWQQWGRAMQDDVADALQWAVKNEGVDAKRVCIAGASYGGYATLMGLARHPDMYRCGVAWVGVTDPRLLFRWSVTSDVRTESREHSYPELIGDPQRDAAMLDSVTPLLLADRIKQPVMLAYGRGDRRVPIEHGERMRDALVKAGNAPQWTVYDDEGHGWLKLETRVDFAQRLERFLAEHLR
jgi:dipeptidyl aminopeptidase/acylaminoacyl peptidase